MNLRDLVISKTAKFAYCTDGALWYQVDDFRFPVPFSETAGACFMPEHKAVNLMRWIRKQLEENEAQKSLQAEKGLRLDGSESESQTLSKSGSS